MPTPTPYLTSARLRKEVILEEILQLITPYLIITYVCFILDWVEMIGMKSGIYIRFYNFYYSINVRL